MRGSRIRRLRGFALLAREFKKLADDLPSHLGVRFQRRRDWIDFEIPGRPGAKRDFYVSASSSEVEYQYGKLWGEGITLSPEGARELLAVCDAIIAGRVREVRDLNTGLTYQVFRLRSRGINKFVRDSEYSLRHYLKEKVRQVRITRIPPLVAQ